LVIAKRLARRLAFRLATSDRVERTVLGIAPLRSLALRGSRRYLAGADQQAALATTDALRARGLSASIDLFGENVGDIADVKRDTDRYLGLARALAAHPGTYLSLDCSHLGLDRDPEGCRARVAQIAAALPAGSRLQLGAEESSRADAIQSLAHAVAADGSPIMVTIQANLRRSGRDVEELSEAGIPIRLVKGAYVEPAHQAYRWGAETDAAFIGLAARLQDLGADHSLATHDSAILRRLLAGRDRAAIEFLFGVREDDARRLARDGYEVRVYVPYGERWFRYYARRVAESIGA
jgi:proline dehydrogenase